MIGSRVVPKNPSSFTRHEFAAFALFLVTSVSLAWMAYSFGGVDFGVYYAAGRVMLNGGNPYDYSQLAGEIVSSTGALNNPFYYAPWFAWAMSVLALLPYEFARLCWAVVNVGLWYWGLFNLSKLIEWPPAGWRRWGAYLFATIIFAWSTWGSEQVGVTILFLVTVLLLSYQQSRQILTGFFMALILFKPNVTGFPGLVLAAWLISRREWKPVISMIVSLSGFLVISLFVSPGWYLALMQPDKLTGLSYTLNENGAAQTLRYVSTLPGWLASYGVTGVFACVIYVFAALLGIIFTTCLVKKSKDMTALTAYSFLVNFALTPYALFYDYSVLVVTLFYLNARLSLRPMLTQLQRLMNGLVIASLFVGDNISFRYWIVVIFILSGISLLKKDPPQQKTS
ncbi:MAG: DUF2029 domain-containing protein [Anaerolineales bacterium]|nr:DUF2029 domain-containing protein [Anaerolineales bacterium]